MKDNEKSDQIYMFRLADDNSETKYWTGSGWSVDPDQAARMIYTRVTELDQQLRLVNPDGNYRIEYLSKFSA